jgi:uncharacterized protein
MLLIAAAGLMSAVAAAKPADQAQRERWPSARYAGNVSKRAVHAICGERYAVFQKPSKTKGGAKNITMKPSRYNFFFQVDDQAILAYNSLTTALAELSTEEFTMLRDFYNEPRDDFLDTDSLCQFYTDLCKNGFLVPEDDDELEKVRELHAIFKQHQQRHIGLTIVPTLDCNFRCTYCFSYARRERMGAKVQEALLRFVEERLSNVDCLSVTWYGGEPTLCIPTVEALSDQLNNLCKRHRVHYLPSHIITNGYLLTERIARRLKAIGISQAQITLDGDQKIHDRRRPLLGGHGTFDRILGNIAAVRDVLDVQVRVNIDRSNAHTAVAVLDALLERGLQGLPVYFGHVQPFTEACSDIASNCFSGQEFSEINLALIREAIARGFSALRYPHLKLGGVCGAEHELSFLIAPDGLLFKCWAQASLGLEHSIGSVFDIRVTPSQEKNLRRFLDWDPQTVETCRKCSVLPICMGGCPYQRLHGVPGSNCAWRNSLLDTLALRYKTQRLMKEQSYA